MTGEGAALGRRADARWRKGILPTQTSKPDVLSSASRRQRARGDGGVAEESARKSNSGQKAARGGFSVEPDPVEGTTLRSPKLTIEAPDNHLAFRLQFGWHRCRRAIQTKAIAENEEAGLRHGPVGTLLERAKKSYGVTIEERKNLCHECAGHVLSSVDPEIAVAQSCPAEATCRPTLLRLICVD